MTQKKYRSRAMVACCALLYATSLFAWDGQTRPSANDKDLKTWLQNMYWHHRYTSEEMQQVTGLAAAEVAAKLQQFKISDSTRPKRPDDKVLVLPYPGGRHPRIGFLEGAIEPQRETKLSVFCPWDDKSYAVMDVPEAIWSNLGLTYLAHTHVDTIWTKQGVDLAQQEWAVLPDGNFVLERKLPNGIVFGTKVIPMKDHVRMKMWLTNGTDKPLSDLRVQNCVMLKDAMGFEQQSNDNKTFVNGYAVVRSPDGSRWMISGWDPVHRPWGNARCPCLHSDPKFPNCEPGETKWLRGWFSFYEGTDINAELARIEATGWRKHPLHHVTGNVTGKVRDADTGDVLPCRLYVQSLDDGEWHYATSTAVAGSAVEYRKQRGNSPSVEKHTTLSADPFQLQLKPGRYRLRVEHGKEFVPAETEIEVTGPERVAVDLRIKRFANMVERGWYSGDTHVHRAMQELPNAVLAEDLNVALPLNYWVRDSTEVPSASGPVLKAKPDYLDDTHVIYPVNTEYEIFSVNKKRHTQGAVFVLNHKTPLNLPAPPTLPIAEEARRQGAILDLDKHSWNWSMMIVPTMGVDLFELSNNHHWRTTFGFPQWTLENAPTDWPEIERNEGGFTEIGWTEFGLQTYYTLLNCGFRMRVTGGTASGVHPVPLGHGRVYVHCADRFTYQNWITNLNAGHSFVTQGPLLDIRFNGQLPGSSWQRSQGENTIEISGTVESLSPLKSIQIIRNGQIATTVDAQSEKTSAGTYRTSLETSAILSGSGWVAVRCFEDLPDDKVSFAHTNPVFMDVDGQPLRPRKQRVKFFVQRMDEEIERNTGILTDEALAEFRAARQIYANILKSDR
ncbi:MAG: CehA/McbA family metallohydrolase [Fuerstiella sp.]|nr:CehA/McbA family metallohydrolase [Fuerstiella sp.]MCP4854285.1 CehA/McbA family metallohydrolase [Fuerstiella sp.]